MRAVIDTNVLVSGLFWKGPPAEILAAWLGEKFHWVVSASILREYDETLTTMVLKYPTPVAAREFLRGINLTADLVIPAALEGPICSDPDDDQFLAAAIAGRASVIVSGDKALLRVNGYRGLQILKPAAFLKMLL